MPEIAIVTGGSSGIGAYVAQTLARSGCKVYELSRREVRQEGICHIFADVTDESLVAKAVEQVFAAEGRINILVNCAGFGIAGAAEFTSDKNAQGQLSVNLLGTSHMVQAVLPIMQKQGGGRIVNISSVAAVIPIPFQAWYSASKAALNSYTLALANEVRPFKISVCAVMPGDTKTGFTEARVKEQAGDDVYRGAISRSVYRMEEYEQNGVSPERVGAYIARIALRKRVRPLYTVGIKYKTIVFLGRVLPVGFLNRMIHLLYI